MNPLPWISGAVVGVAVSAALIVACSDDAPTSADAASCDCPPAEPPLAGRIVEVSRSFDFSAPGGADLANCPPGGTVLGGSCIVVARGPGPGDLTLYEFGRRFDTATFACEWHSTVQAVSTGKVTAICLVPAP